MSDSCVYICVSCARTLKRNIIHKPSASVWSWQSAKLPAKLSLPLWFCLSSYFFSYDYTRRRYCAMESVSPSDAFSSRHWCSSKQRTMYIHELLHLSKIFLTATSTLCSNRTLIRSLLQNPFLVSNLCFFNLVTFFNLYTASPRVFELLYNAIYYALYVFVYNGEIFRITFGKFQCV